MKKAIVSFVLLAVVFSMGFFLGSYFLKPQWNCPACSFDASERIVPLINGQYAPVALEEISKAKSQIYIVMYEMKFYTTNNSVRKLEDVLVQKKKDGLDVKVILEQGEWQGQITSLTKENQKSLDFLKSSGVEVKFDDIKTTTHDKLIIIDGETVILGSHNWAYSALEKNNEASILLKNRDITAYYKNYFDNLWKQY